VIGVVGGIGSGKTALARRLAESPRYAVLDGDAAGHNALRDPQVKGAVTRRFGSGVLDEDGEIRRSALAAEVFGETERHHQARIDLEAIVHPAIRHALRTQIAQAHQRAQQQEPQPEPGRNGANPANQTQPAALLLDAAVLLEAGWRDVCDAVVFIDAPQAIRQHRVAENRGWSPEELRRRQASQLDLEHKRQAADFVVDNSGRLETAAEALRRIVELVIERTAENAAENAAENTNESAAVARTALNPL
jgi:dephospho-CoA kinase